MQQERILVLDDEDAIRELCAAILRGHGYLVTIARTGQEAIECLQKEEFDLLLTDISMPGMSGLEVAQAAKAVCRQLVCVTMTGYSTMDMAIQALKLGVDEFLLKPYHPEELHAAIARALEKARLRRENDRLRALLPLFDLNKTLLRTVDPPELLEKLRRIALSETQANHAWIFRAQGLTDPSSLIVGEGSHLPQEEASCKAATIALKAGRQLLFDCDTSDREELAILRELQARSVLATPIEVRGSFGGVLVVARTHTAFAAADANLLNVLAGQAGIALENARLFAELQHAYEEVKNLDRMKGEFIAIAAHELRTPLAIVKAYTEAVQEELQGAHNDYFTTILRNCARLRHLISSMLDLQVLERGVIPLSQDCFDLRHAVEEAIKDVSLWAEEKGLRVVTDIASDVPPLVADRHKIDLILSNLLNNAVKFTPPRGHITLRAYQETAGVVISLQNTGISIPACDWDRVFDRFYQVEQSLTREHEGLGLGLAIVRGMVEVCGGDIHVESEEGKSTTFLLRLPVSQDVQGAGSASKDHATA